MTGNLLYIDVSNSFITFTLLNFVFVDIFSWFLFA